MVLYAFVLINCMCLANASFGWFGIFIYILSENSAMGFVCVDYKVVVCCPGGNRFDMVDSRAV